jgi:hypothetical protein
MEIWKDIIGYEGLYIISSYGRIKNLRTNLYLNVKQRSDGYIRIGLYNKGKQTYYYLARLVYKTFKGIENNNFEINHIDNNKLNNNLNNLELISSRENSCHRSKLNPKKSSIYNGVSKMKNNSWKSYIYFNGKQVTLGIFKTELQAYNTRVQFEKDNSILNKYL